MRVAIVYDCLYPASIGGGELVYRRMADVLVGLGHDVDYLTRDSWSPAPPPATGFALRVVWRGEIADASGQRRPSAALAFARGVAKALRRDGAYDLVIASSLPVLTLLAAAWALRGRRSVLVADWLEVWGLRKWHAYSGAVAGTVAWVLQFLGAHAARRHTVNSEFTARRLRALARSAEIVVLGLVDLAEQAPRARPSEPPHLLVIGRLIADKRVDALPPALAIVREQIPEVRLLIVGSGPAREAVEDAVRASGLSDAVEFLGHVDDDRLAELRRSAAALVHPSAREGFGLVVAEAAAAGVPSVVVAGPDNAAVELIEPGVNGVIAPSADPEDLAHAILEVLGAGQALRDSTAAWFADARRTRSISASLARIIPR